ncbi:MAG: hypothetical protein K2W95_24225 [Candidatus Obscuribacterales bacterium]|nr:hypothetical protein [Candidatus Obscuribacterales bacterium]
MLFINLRHERLQCSSSLLVAAICVAVPASQAQQGSGQNEMDAAFSAPPITTGSAHSTTVKPLTGTIQRNAGLRIERGKAVKAPDQEYQPLDGAAFAQPPPVLPAAPLAAAADKSAEAPKRKHLWHQSRDGGYYDATGAIGFLVPGDELYKYGGVFEDGLPVPTTPVAMNFAKHCYRFPFVVKRMPQSGNR